MGVRGQRPLGTVRRLDHGDVGGELPEQGTAEDYHPTTPTTTPPPPPHALWLTLHPPPATRQRRRLAQGSYGVPCEDEQAGRGYPAVHPRRDQRPRYMVV